MTDSAARAGWVLSASHGGTHVKTGRLGGSFVERAGHAHAGVLLVLALAVLDLLPRTNLSDAGQWAVGALLLAGALAQSGGMFLHMGIGQPGRWSAGNSLTVAGGVLLAAAILTAAAAVITT